MRKTVSGLSGICPALPATCADTAELDAWGGFKPATLVKEGVKEFVEWYLQFHNIQKQ